MKFGPWTDEERAFLLAHWEELDDAALALALRRPMSSVTHRRLGLGLKRSHTGYHQRFLDRDTRPPR
jgi:hypothetical protein